MKKFEWVDHPADVGFIAYGQDLGEAFENAALALTEIIADSDKIGPSEEVELEVVAEDTEALLYDWLDNLLYLFGAENFLGSRFEIEEFSANDKFELKGKAWGERHDPERHGYGTEVKAITYHMMEVNCDRGKCSVRVIVDI